MYLNIFIYPCQLQINSIHPQRKVLRIENQAMGLEQYDPYSIKSYSFAVRKTNSFFSLPTVLISLAVISSSILINLKTVSNLWIPISSLSVISSQSLELPDSLTSTIVCIKPLLPANKNSFQLYRADLTPISFQTLSEEQIALTYPQLHAQIGSDFACVDLNGFTFLFGDDILYVQVEDVSATMYVQGSSINSILNSTEDVAMVINSSNTYQFPPLKTLTFLKCTIYNELYLNYQPIVLNTVKTDTNSIKYFASTFTANNTFFGLGIYYPDSGMQYIVSQNNLQTFLVQRQNLGQILGAVLSWISIFALIIGLIVAPLMDIMLNLLVTETLFHLQAHMHTPSLFKFILASIKSGIFSKQDRYVKMCQLVEKMKNVNTIIKLQMLFSKLIPQTHKPISHELIASEHSFNQVSKSQIGVDLFPDTNECHLQEIDFSQDPVDQSCLTKIRKKILHILDPGSDLVSVAYRKGGIGSKGSFCVTLIFVIGLIAFLVIFGILQSTTTVSRYNTYTPEQTFTIPAYTIFFATSTVVQPNITLLNGNYQAISTVQAQTGSNCTQYLTINQYNTLISYASNISCIPFDISLVLSNNPNTSVYIFIDQSVYSGYMYSKQTGSYPYYTAFPKVIRIPLPTYDNYYYQQAVSQISITSNHITYNTYQFQVMQGYNNIFAESIQGIVLIIDDSILTIQQTTTTIYTMIQNVWAFTIVCFTVIVMKITKYVNLREKQQSITPEKAEFRDSICIFLARIDGLLHGRHRSQLQQLKYYIKQPLLVK